jgi:hypothetical protein
MILFWDTSALAKLFFTKSGTEQVSALLTSKANEN